MNNNGFNIVDSPMLLSTIDQVTIPASNIPINSNGSYTVAMSIYITGTSGYDNILQWGDNGRRTPVMFVDPSGTIIRNDLNDAGGFSFDAPMMSNWGHLAMSYDSELQQVTGFTNGKVTGVLSDVPQLVYASNDNFHVPGPAGNVSGLITVSNLSWFPHVLSSNDINYMINNNVTLSNVNIEPSNTNTQSNVTTSNSCLTSLLSLFVYSDGSTKYNGKTLINSNGKIPQDMIE
jgi:hypothetical protein